MPASPLWASVAPALRFRLARSTMARGCVLQRARRKTSADSDGATTAWAAVLHARLGRRHGARPYRRAAPLASSAKATLGRTPGGSGIDGGPHVLVAEIDAALIQIVRRHFHGDAIPGQDTDAVLLHAPRGVGDDFMPVVELHAAARVGQHLSNNTFELKHLFLGHAFSCGVEGPALSSQIHAP